MSLTLLGVGSASASAGAGVDIAGGLVAYWPFTDDANDDSGNSVDATLVGTAAINGCLNVTVAGDGATRTSVGGIQFTSSFSLACWFKASADGTMLVKPVASGTWISPYAEYGLRIGGGKLEAWSGDAGSTVLGATTVTDGVWRHACATWDGSTIKVYLNGVLDGSGASGGDPASTGEPLQIGQNSNSGENYVGRLRDVRMYSRALSAADVAVLASLSFLDPTDLAAYFRLASTDDNSGNSLTLTNNNSVTFGTGKVGNCATFVKASSQYLSRADNALLSMAAEQDFTVVMWAQVASTGSNLMLASKGVSALQADYEYTFWLGTTNLVNFELSNGTTDSFLTATAFGALALNTWYFLAFRYDAAGNLQKIRVNTSDYSKSWTTGSFNSTHSLIIGARGSGGFPYDGKLDEVAVFRRHLTDSELTYLYNAGNGRALW